MSMSQLLEESEAQLLNLETLPPYDRDAMSLFTNEELVCDPFMDFAFHEDVTAAHESFLQHKSKIADATFTSFLFWCAAKSIATIRHCNFRFVAGKWYELMNPPFYMPFATGQESRLASAVFRNIKSMSYESFAIYYAETANKARQGELSSHVGKEMFAIAHNIVNLPNLRFTNVKPQSAREKSAHVWWIMGQRYEKDGMLHLPISIRMNHANGDPVILHSLMELFRSHF